MLKGAFKKLRVIFTTNTGIGLFSGIPGGVYISCLKFTEISLSLGYTITSQQASGSTTNSLK
ncbi:hypothetical protein [Pyrococcus kukulkanii]|uniref:hypothetical protein n=1 Tax=Pyrococcus kukulkanii TaxID=1609559 RepID=UPI0035632598